MRFSKFYSNQIEYYYKKFMSSKIFPNIMVFRTDGIGIAYSYQEKFLIFLAILID